MNNPQQKTADWSSPEIIEPDQDNSRHIGPRFLAKRLDSFLKGSCARNADYAYIAAGIDDDERGGTEIMRTRHTMNECEIARYEAAVAFKKGDDIWGA